MRILKNLPQKIKIKEATEMLGNAFGKKPWKIKKFYENLGSREAKIMAKKGSYGSLSKKQVEQLFRDTKEKSGFYYSEAKARKTINETAEKESVESAKEKKQRLIKYGRERTKTAKMMERVRAGRLIDSKIDSERDSQDKTKEKRNEKIDRIRNIKINASPNQSQNNPDTNTDNSYSDGWTNEEQKSGLSDNSKEPKKDAPQKEQPIDMFID
ncbi:hypothetical protein KAS41_03885 [Candidatus Parcubacteria bacterium]|nr:hypothetical protein [Candidatus Parcubacteria bacterium]